MSGRFASSKLTQMALLTAWLAISGCSITSTTNSTDKECPTMSTANRIRLEHVAINVKDPVPWQNGIARIWE